MPAGSLSTFPYSYPQKKNHVLLDRLGILPLRVSCPPCCYLTRVISIHPVSSMEKNQLNSSSYMKLATSLRHRKPPKSYLEYSSLLVKSSMPS
jgi:hypothetical protein